MKKIVIIFILLLLIVSIYACPRCDRLSAAVVEAPYEEVRADSAHGFDVLSYDITMNIDETNSFVSGAVIAVVEAEETITEIIYELEAMTVIDVQLNGSTANYTYDGSLITIQLGTVNMGEQFTTEVVYSGNPIWNGLGMYFSNSHVFTISDPNASRYWWPCYDHPWDKAITDLHITVRDDWMAACNGIRTSIMDNYDGTMTHNWEGSNPMATYLVSIVAQNYVELYDSYSGIPIQNFVSPSVVPNATEDFSNLPFMMEVYTGLFGDYPFEKYGNAVTNFATYSAMEHQTMTTLGSQNINGNHGGEMVIAHELSHQWYGDCLTCLTWKDIWLSEGFATYSEALYMEAWQGFEAMVDYVYTSIQQYYLSWGGSSPQTVYDPAPNAYFTPATYEKPASVLHMLRLKTGDDVFFQIMQEYYLVYHNGNVITDDFQDVCESVSGMDLDQFFLQWIYQPGLPSIQYTYFFNPYMAIPRIMTYVQTSSNTDTEFYIDVPFHIYSGTEVDSVLVQGTPNTPLQTISITDIPVYDDVECDPNNWVLQTGITFIQAEINNAYSADESVIIYWNEFWSEVGIDGYNLYRAESVEDPFLIINSEIITGNSYTDNNVVNGTTYYYKLKAIKDEFYETPFSEAYEATPLDFPLDQGILVIDETNDGNGMQGNPDDASVDDFYEDIINCNITTYDYADEGELDLEYIVNFSTIILHDDDIISHSIDENLDVLGCYLAGGGNLIISGWKTALEIPDSFRSDFLDCGSIEQVFDWEFTGATSDEYEDLVVDPDKVHVAFSGMLPYIGIFPESTNGIYQYDGIAGNQYIGENCALKSQPNGHFALLGFPLYFTINSGAELFMTQLLDEIGEVWIDDCELETMNLELKNYPNPFNPSTTISFNLNAEITDDTELMIYNLKGQKIKTFDIILGGVGRSSNQQVTWNGTDQNNNPVASGIYFYKLKSGDFEISRKMLLLK
ncbi:MAG: T9SS type A sorting domain-containing protein [Candidatus Cloacimonetes bacterium]|nr:T9SS type A sorting domain-containing protein [Candidatus Cloacimonadota bacterium]